MFFYVKNCIFEHITDTFFSGDRPPLETPGLRCVRQDGGVRTAPAFNCDQWRRTSGLAAVVTYTERLRHGITEGVRMVLGTYRCVLRGRDGVEYTVSRAEDGRSN